MTRLEHLSIWRSNDPRDNGREVQIICDTINAKGEPAVLVRNTNTGRHTTIRAKAFDKQSQRGYTRVTAP